MPSLVAASLDWLTVSVGDKSICQAIQTNLLNYVSDELASAVQDSSGTSSAHTEYTWFDEFIPVQVNRSGIVLHLADQVHVQLFMRPTGAAVQLTVYSACLWSRPLADIVRELRFLVMCLADVEVDTTPLWPVRVDLCADVSGVSMEDISDAAYLDACLVSRCVTRSSHSVVLETENASDAASDTAPGVSVFARRRRVESLYIGSSGGAVRWNWYDKLADIRAKGHSSRYADTWAMGGFRVGEDGSSSVPLTRFEARVNAQFLREFRCLLSPDRLELASLSDALPFLWSYLTTHTRLIQPDSGSGNRSRAFPSSLWLLISSAFSSPSRLSGWREHVPSASPDRLSAQLSGVAVSLLAILRRSDMRADELPHYLSSLVLRHVSTRGGLQGAVLVRQARLGVGVRLSA